MRPGCELARLRRACWERANGEPPVNSLLGHICIWLALACATFGAVCGIVGGLGWRPSLQRRARGAAFTFAGAMLAANAVMVAALLHHDFSVGYVAQVGSLKTPPLYTVVSLWSSLEGSILFWGLILGVYIAAFAAWLGDRHPDTAGFALGTMLAVAAFFAFLIAAPADPFRLLSPAPADGPGPNPLLQNHVLMIIHPPMLYLGYVGLTVPFGVAMAALMRGVLSPAWLKVMRLWTMVPWMFLSVGIVLGSWWAYEVLGWGGYWAWDPVENASFLPWLAATAYLHASVVQARRRILKAWTVALVLSAFLLTILGTFMTRSGIFNSVHSFTQSSIGPVFLVFLGVLTAISAALLLLRSHLLEDDGRVSAPASREAAFIANNVLFVVFTLTVLLGTVYPLLAEAFSGVKVSVGEPFFNRMALPSGLAMVFLMGVGPVLPWGQARLEVVLRDFVLPMAAGGATVLAAVALGLGGAMALATFGLCGFAGYVTLRELVAPAWQRSRRNNVPPMTALAQYWAGSRRRVGGYIVHLAVILTVAAIAASQSYRQVAEASLAPGESMHIAGYQLTFLRAEGHQEVQRFSILARLKVALDDGEVLGEMAPRMNFYPSQREPVGTPHVATLGQSDLYVSLMHVEPNGERVGLKAYHIPMVAWIWRSLPLWVLGSTFSLWPRRRPRITPSAEPGAAGAEPLPQAVI